MLSGTHLTRMLLVHACRQGVDLFGDRLNRLRARGGVGSRSWPRAVSISRRIAIASLARGKAAPRREAAESIGLLVSDRLRRRRRTLRSFHDFPEPAACARMRLGEVREASPRLHAAVVQMPVVAHVRARRSGQCPRHPRLLPRDRSSCRMPWGAIRRVTVVVVVCLHRVPSTGLLELDFALYQTLVVPVDVLHMGTVLALDVVMVLVGGTR